MATKKQDLPAVQQTGAVADWQSILKASAQRAVQSASEVATGAAPRIGFSETGISFNGENIGKSSDFIITGVAFVRHYFDRPYDEKNPTGPLCYSYDGETPHPKAHKPQAKLCKDCPFDKFDSNPNGRGSKGCSEVARFAAIHVDDLKKGRDVEPAIANASVLNRKVVARYFGSGVPIGGAVTTVTCNPPSKGSRGYDLDLKLKNTLQIDAKTGPVLAALVQASEKKLSEPAAEYDDSKPARRANKFSKGK